LVRFLFQFINVRDLCDVKKQGALNKHYFGVAMHLVGFKKVNTNFQLPLTLPPTLMEQGGVKTGGSFSGTGGFINEGFSLQQMDPGFNAPVISGPVIQPQSSMSFQQPNYLNPLSQPNFQNGGGFQNGGSNIQMTTKVNSLLKESSQLKDEYFNVQQNVLLAQTNLEQNKQQENQLLEEIQTLKPQIEELRSKKQQFQQEQARLEAKLLMLREDSQASKELALQLSTEVERLNLLKGKGEESVFQLKQSLETAGESIKTDTSLLESRQNEIFQLKTEYDLLVEKMNGVQGSVNQTQLDELTIQIRKQRNQNEELSKKLASLETKNIEITKKYETNKKIHQEFTEKIQLLNTSIAAVEKQIEEKSKIPNLKPKLVRLEQFHDTAVKYLQEMKNIIEGLPTDSSISPLNEDMFAKPITKPTVKPTTTTSTAKPTTQPPPKNEDFGFGNDGFGEDSFDSFDKTSGHGKDFSIQNNSSKPLPVPPSVGTPKKVTETKIEDLGPQMPNFKNPKPAPTQPAVTDSFDGFDGFDTGTGGFDGFDDFDKKPTDKAPVTSNSGFDDFDFGTSTTTQPTTKPTSAKVSNPTPSNDGFDDFGDFDDFGTPAVKKTETSGFDDFDGFDTNTMGATTTQNTTKTQEWGDFGTDPW
jgi:hypothetical protein